VFIISKISLTSEICGLENVHAVKHNKRLIPIVCGHTEAVCTLDITSAGEYYLGRSGWGSAALAAFAGCLDGGYLPAGRPESDR